jgi:hypothetical protein
VLKSGYNLHGEMDWHTTVTLPPGAVAWLWAQNQSEHGSVVATIETRGQVQRIESSGAYCIARASM